MFLPSVAVVGETWFDPKIGQIAKVSIDSQLCTVCIGASRDHGIRRLATFKRRVT